MVSRCRLGDQQMQLSCAGGGTVDSNGGRCQPGRKEPGSLPNRNVRQGQGQVGLTCLNTLFVQHAGDRELQQKEFSFAQRWGVKHFPPLARRALPWPMLQGFASVTFCNTGLLGPPSILHVSHAALPPTAATGHSAVEPELYYSSTLLLAPRISTPLDLE